MKVIIDGFSTKEQINAWVDWYLDDGHEDLLSMVACDPSTNLPIIMLDADVNTVKTLDSITILLKE